MRELSCFIFSFHNDPPFRQIAGRHFQYQPVPKRHADPARLDRAQGDHAMAIGQLHPAHAVGPHLDDDTFNSDGVSCHVSTSGPAAVTSTVCSK